VIGGTVGRALLHWTSAAARASPPRPVPLPSALEAALVDSFDRIKSALPPLISYQRLGNERGASAPRRSTRAILILPDYTRRYVNSHTCVYANARASAHLDSRRVGAVEPERAERSRIQRARSRRDPERV